MSNSTVITLSFVRWHLTIRRFTYWSMQ